MRLSRAALALSALSLTLLAPAFGRIPPQVAPAPPAEITPPTRQSQPGALNGSMAQYQFAVGSFVCQSRNGVATLVTVAGPGNSIAASFRSPLLRQPFELTIAPGDLANVQRVGNSHVLQAESGRYRLRYALTEMPGNGLALHIERWYGDRTVQSTALECRVAR